MRLRLLSFFLLAYCSIAVAQVPAPAPRPADQPIALPPGERQPSALSLPAQDGTDALDWSHADLNTAAAWKYTKGEGQVVAVFDTGADLKHRDLKGQIVGTIDETGEGVNDINSHGTWCANHIAAAENGWGMAGHMPRAKLLIVKVLGGRDGSGSTRGIARGMRKAADWRGPNGERVTVFSLSLGGPSRDGDIPPEIAYAKSKGIIVVAAAGNEGPREGTVGYPGGYPDVVCVAAHDKRGLTASFSSRGVPVLVSGPGVDTRAGVPNDLFGTYSGTSMSTPAVAAAAAAWCAVKGGAMDATRGDRFRADLQLACSHPDRRDTATGYGKLDMGKLVSGGTVPPPPPPPGGFTGDVPVIVTFRDGKPVGAKLGTAAAAVDRAAIEKAVKEEMDRALTDAASGAKAIDWSALLRAIVDAILRSLLSGQADGTGTTAAPPAKILGRLADGSTVEIDRTTWDALPSPPSAPTPTPVPPALAVPRFAFPPPAQACPGGRCPLPLAW